MGAGGGHGQALLGGQLAHDPAQPHDLVSGLADVPADPAAHLDLALHHLRLELVAEQLEAAFEQALAPLGQGPAVRVDDLVLLFDPQGQGR